MTAFTNINQPIRSQTDEYKGYAAGDNHTPMSDPEEVLGLDPNEWTVVGFELYPGSDDLITVYAERAGDLTVESDDDRHAAWLAAVDARGSLPVHRFTVYTEPGVLERLFKRLEVRMFRSELVEKRISVDILSDRTIGADEG